MEVRDNGLNISIDKQNDRGVPPKRDFITDAQLGIFIIVIDVFLCGSVSLVGVIANVINLIVFYKQGLKTTINIGFFAMACSDLCSVIMQLWYSICANPLFRATDTPLVFDDLQHISAGVPREVFSRITCMITVYVTAERCLCIAFPLHAKQILTPKITTTIIVLIYLVIWSYVIHLYTIHSLSWKLYPYSNRTLLGLVMSTDSATVQAAAYFTHGTFAIGSFLAVVVFTSILIRKLKQTSAWRQTMNPDRNKSASISKRDKNTITMIVLIACVLIITYTPSVVLCVTTVCEPEFIFGGRFFNTYYVTWSIAFFLETINSSVNIVLYLTMSTRFRETFRALFSTGAKSS